MKKRFLALLLILAMVALVLGSGWVVKTSISLATSGYNEDDIVYIPLTDRFPVGDPSNNDQGAPGGEYQPDNLKFYQGGDWQGVINKIPYIKNLGVTAIWLSPVSDDQDVSEDGGVENGDIGGLDDLAQEVPAVEQELYNVYQYWFTQTGADAARVDAARSMPKWFLQSFENAIGLGNSIYIRGSTPPLSWNSGQPATWTPQNIWVWETSDIPETTAFEFKPLINDTTWSQGNNYWMRGGMVVEVYPNF